MAGQESDALQDRKLSLLFVVGLESCPPFEAADLGRGEGDEGRCETLTNDDSFWEFVIFGEGAGAANSKSESQ